jgi:hypothetical protein
MPAANQSVELTGCYIADSGNLVQFRPAPLPASSPYRYKKSGVYFDHDNKWERRKSDFIRKSIGFTK